MKNINTFGLDSLIAIYFGQDYDLFGSGESVSAQIDAWIADTPVAFREGMIGDIDQFYQECDNFDQDFQARYGDDFSTELWETTPGDFLELLREKVKASLPDPS
ncbi:contact-dependent growth inhibition system immunity protein [Erwiniaceae bacterium BAC15a-03b]|uniref:Contact-dependent growth inhibition system immunity protein n=1 Tax=Winslowiella arboricola TaxID=2978220 RepID=A0A9J6PMU9_9GAMM|nr:contact-dependent growth inhibition system immunity protein [Winslowiella arboricola]MCU5775517.1 contact-dependent growth inhibition system immunity protein [Winslowiella arboricola]MCU5779633.1 contact-dependent growth inhibition system immunity protein [Winslowiella arboricola]